MSNGGENLPLVQDDKHLVLKKNIYDFSRRAMKFGLAAGAITIGTLASVTLGNFFAMPIASKVALAAGVGAMMPPLNDGLFYAPPGLTFYTQKAKDGTGEIYQKTLSSPKYFKDVSDLDKASIMALQTLVGFERYKKDMEINGTEKFEENGKTVYGPKYATITHSLNIKNLQALHEAGYIDIINEEDSFYHPGEDRIAFLGIKPRPYRSLLIFEKIGFSNTEGLKDIFNKAVKGDKKGLDEMRKDFKKITFRLTDKSIDFEDIYKKVNGYIPYESEEEKKNLKRLRTVFLGSKDKIPGPLSGRKMVRGADGKMVREDRVNKFDIATDRFGRCVFVPYAKESFGERIERQMEQEKVAKSQHTEEPEKDSFAKEYDARDSVDLEAAVKQTQNAQKQSKTIEENKEEEI